MILDCEFKHQPQEFVLGITIPTYNRADRLALLVNSIVNDFETWPSDLEIIILNNASTDPTAKIIEEYIKKGVPIRHVERPTNIGMDRNLADCFGATNAKYLWQIGDDEILHKGCAKYVLDVCRKSEFGVMHAECIGFKCGNEDKQIKLNIPSAIKMLELDSKKLFRLVNVSLTFISSNIINRKAILDSNPDFDPLSETGTFLPHLAWIFNALKISSRNIYIRTPIFSSLTENTGGYKLIEVFGINLLNITYRQLSSSIPYAKRLMSNAVITRLMPGQLLFKNNTRKNNSFEAEDVKLVLGRAFEKNLYYYFIINLILSDSRIVRRSAFFVIRVFNYFNKRLNYLLL